MWRKFGGGGTFYGARGRMVPQLQGLLELAATYNLVAGKVVGVRRTPPDTHLGAAAAGGVVRFACLPCHPQTPPVKTKGSHSRCIELKLDQLRQRRYQDKWKGNNETKHQPCSAGLQDGSVNKRV